jgi:hypothetical protein
MSHENGFPEIEFPSINDIHDEALIQHFMDGINHKVLIITPSFPFLFIGKIIKVVEDHVVVDVQITPIHELENRRWHIHIHQIELFFIERPEGPRIPELSDQL